MKVSEMKKTIVFMLIVFPLLSSCGPKALYLKNEDIHVPSENDIMKVCLSQAIHEINSGSPQLTKEEKKPLQGVSTEYFLWWGSLSGPVPVINRNNQPGEARTAIPIVDKSKLELSERYVLCLLANGFSWPDEDWVKERFNETTK